MPSAGRFDYPGRPLDDMVPYLKKTYEVAGELSKREDVAEALEMAVKGGGFATLVSAMQNYGLVETGGGQIRVTALGKTVAYETDSTLLSRAKAEAVLHVGLFKEYNSQYGTDVSDEKVRVFLRKAGVDAPQLPKLTEGIGKLLKDNLHYLAAVSAGASASGVIPRMTGEPVTGFSPSQGGERNAVTASNEDSIEFRMGTYLMRFPMDDIATARSVINTLLDSKKTSQDSPKEAPVERE